MSRFANFDIGRLAPLSCFGDPSFDLKPFLSHVSAQGKLTTDKPGAGKCSIYRLPLLSVFHHPTLASFCASARDREAIGSAAPFTQETLAQAVALLGPERVGIPVPSASHQPDAFILRPPPVR